MNWVIHQTIMIQQIRIDSVSQASILQIGSAGKVSSFSQSYEFGAYRPGMFNAGGLPVPGQAPTYGVQPSAASLVPLPSLT